MLDTKKIAQEKARGRFSKVQSIFFLSPALWAWD